MRAAQKARWARIKGTAQSIEPATEPKRKFSAAGRAALSAAAKASLQYGGGGGDFDRFTGLGDLQTEIHAPHLVCVYAHVGLRRGLEGRGGHRNFVWARLNVGELVSAAVVGSGFAAEAGIDIKRCHLGAGNGGGTGIGHVAGERSI